MRKLPDKWYFINFSVVAVVLIASPLFAQDTKRTELQKPQVVSLDTILSCADDPIVKKVFERT
jgi:hypothetical protein